MAARGNRITGTGRFGVAFLATAAFGLAVLQPASAADATPSQATETSPATTPASAPASEGAAATTQSEAAPAAPASTPAPESSPAQPSSTPSTGSAEAKTPDGGAPAPDAAAAPAGAPAETTGTAKPVETTPATTPKDAVKLEEAPASTTTTSTPVAPAPSAPAPSAPAPSAPAPAAPLPAAAPPSGAPREPAIILVQITAPAPAPAATTAPDAEAAKTEAAKAEAAKAEADDAAVEIVSLRPRPAPAAIELLPEADVETEGKAAPKTLVVVPLRRPLVRPRTCISPMARVTLSDRCQRAYAIASLQVRFTTPLASLPEVRAAIARGAPPRAIVRKVEARPPPESKAAKERPVAEVRPIVPFGHSGQGMTNDGFSGSPGSASTSRLFVITVAMSLRGPWPSRFARLRQPSTLPHGVIPAPPSARPG